MSYTENYFRLKKALDSDLDVIAIPDSNMVIRNYRFDSVIPHDITFTPEDNRIKENFHFRYPVVMPADIEKASEAIIFLHGLNERTWHKHLTGAKMLAERAHRPVVLFPLSFHINRGLPEWTDVRKLSEPLQKRKDSFHGLTDASVVNLALSQRLTESPQRFLLSGFQSTLDLIRLIRSIKAGEHPAFLAGARTDLFAYSISCMMLQSLMISNPGNILSNSRIVLFAGGSVFSHMNGISRYIMDNVAFNTLRKYYMRILESGNTFLDELRPLVMEHNFGKAFRTLISADKFRKQREKGMDTFFKNLMIIALKEDKVMPVNGIIEATGQKFARTERFKIMDFPYPYTHENPFPVLSSKLEKQVEDAFISVFNPALNFYCQS